MERGNEEETSEGMSLNPNMPEFILNNNLDQPFDFSEF